MFLIAAFIVFLGNTIYVLFYVGETQPWNEPQLADHIVDGKVNAADSTTVAGGLNAAGSTTVAGGLNAAGSTTVAGSLTLPVALTLRGA